MKDTKISRIKFYQSIKCNSKMKSDKNEFSYIDSSQDPYDLAYQNGLIIITHKETKEITCTGMHNVVYFNPKDEK